MRRKLTDYLNLTELAQLPDLELRARYLVDGVLNGLHLSPYTGTNVEFKEHRKYVHGDALRQIDWKVFGRTDRLHVKLHEDDTNWNCYILLDKSKSMDFQSGPGFLTKFDYARTLAATLILFLQRQGDAGAISLLGNHLRKLVLPGTSAAGWEKSLMRMDTTPDAVQTDWAGLVKNGAKEIFSKSLVVILSDFYLETGKLAALLEQLAQKNCETLLLQIFDPEERDFVEGETLKLEDCESGNHLTVTPELLQDEYRQKFAAHQQKLQLLAATYGGEYLPLCTDLPPVSAFGAYLKIRDKRRYRR